MDATLEPVIDLAVALGIGLMIGIEREHHRQEIEDPSDVLFGVRTLALLAVFGWACGALAGVWSALPIAGLAATVVVVAVAAPRGQAAAHGFTTEVTAIVTFVLALLVHAHREVAVIAGITTTVLLVSKPWFGKWVPRLSRVDFTSTLQLAVVLAVVLPLLPDSPVDRWHAVVPRKVGLFVTLILGIDYVGYILTRILGARRSAALTGTVGGLASSTAVTLTMARRAREQPEGAVMGQLAVFLANTTMAVRIALVAAIISPRILPAIVPPLGALAAVMLAGALWKAWQLRRAGGAGGRKAELHMPNPMSLLNAIKWGAVFVAVLFAAAAGQQLFGNRGLLATAAVSGAADVDAILFAVTRRVASAELDARMAAVAIVLATATNTVVKGTLAWVAGATRFGRDVAIVFAAAVVAGGTVALLGLR